MMADVSLTGNWIGIFAYLVAMPAVPVEISLTDTGATVTGVSKEPNTFRPDQGAELVAEFSGLRTGDSVRLKKTYIGFSQGDHPIYDGRISADFQRIDGTWRFARSGFRGTFKLRRQPPLKAAAKRRLAATVD